MRFLSTEWFDAFEEALRSLEPPDANGERVAIGQLITGGPDGDVRYTLLLGGNLAPELVRDSTQQAQVTLVEDYRTACAIASGSSPAEALGSGRVKVRGDANTLIAAQERLGTLVEPLAELASATDFSDVN